MANGVLIACKQPGGVTGPGSASVAFGPDGTVTTIDKRWCTRSKFLNKPSINSNIVRPYPHL